MMQSLNAFVAEGQNMFVHTGLIMTLDTPNELSGVLAHETGHLADGHLVRMSQGVRAASVPLILSMVLGVAAIAAGAGDAGSAILMGGQQIAQRTFLSFSRTQESAADQAGIRYLAATKQSGRGMLSVFKRFENQEILSDQRRDPFAQSHPASGDRMSALQHADRSLALSRHQGQSGVAIRLRHAESEAQGLYPTPGSHASQVPAIRHVEARTLCARDGLFPSARTW